MIVPAEPYTFRRWRHLSTQRSTLLRALENEVIARVELNGRTLDVGGGKLFDYRQRLTANGSWHSLNITQDVHPSAIADLEKGLPVLSDSYDNIVSFNTLEHLRDDALALREILRVLRPGGTFHLTVPFLHRVHGRYGDFHRHTAEWWEQQLESLGIPSDACTILPLVWSPISSAFAQFPWFAGGRGGRTLRRFVMLLPLASMGSRTRREPYALGLYIAGTKQVCQ